MQCPYLLDRVNLHPLFSSPKWDKLSKGWNRDEWTLLRANGIVKARSADSNPVLFGNEEGGLKIIIIVIITIK